MKNIDTIIFDLGGVLIDWNPDYVFDKLFDDKEKKQFFFENICTSAWNEEQDAGRSISQATSELINKFPEWTFYIEAYYGKWKEMLGGPIHETVTIFKNLKDTGRYKLYALTNWSAETFPYALATYDFLHWFDGRVVSGEEKMRKPQEEFYRVLLDRFNVDPAKALFIDDNTRNIKAAEEIGIECLHFQSPEQLKRDLFAMELF
jgi:2-haloacid dehalogenase